jgi:hypothetical protein
MEDIIFVDQFEWFLRFKARPLVYLLCNRSNEIVYIGKSNNFPRRLSYHSEKDWFREVTHIKLLVIDGNEEDLFKKEMKLIRIHQPKYNRMGISGPGDEEDLLDYLRRNPFVTEHQLATGTRLAAWKRTMILDSLLARGIVSRGAPKNRKAQWHIIPKPN